MQFSKMHGLGNDFIIVNHNSLENLDISDLAVAMSHRHLGLGCDQFIVYKEINRALYQMWIYNQDGSIAGACGNATRCLAKIAYKKYGINKISIDVLGRILECNIVSENLIEVNMGKVSFDKKWMPESAKIWNLAKLYNINPKDILCVDIGNPHLIFLTDTEILPEDQKLLGEIFEKHSLFTDGVNVNFAHIHSHEILLKVWERGVGFTIACGSGACASFAAANKLGFVGENTKVHFASGSLEMYIKNNDIYMIGPATLVAEGEYYGA